MNDTDTQPLVPAGAPPLIGLTGRRKKGSAIAGFPAPLEAADVDLYFADYARGILAAGGVPVYLTPDIDAEAAVARLDGLVLTGGADLDPALYGAAPETDLYPPEPARDRYEIALLEAAYARDLPVLGICRGIQLLDVHAGGSLHQHVPSHACFDLHPGTRVHEVRTLPGTRLRDLYGERIEVNSLHHQTLDRVAEGWVVSAVAADGTVEGIEAPDRDVVAVQWHPEMLDTRDDDPVFRWLVDAAGRRLAGVAR